MESILHYLELKNQYFEKMYQMTLKQLKLCQEGQWDELELFVENRERILNIIRSYDFKIAREFKQIEGEGALLNKYSLDVKKLLDQRKMIAEKIVKIDIEVISKMEEIKNDTIKDLKKTVETNHYMQAFNAMGQKIKST
jgi:hypothetical protein